MRRWLERNGFYVFLAVLIACLGAGAWRMRNRPARRAQDTAQSTMAETGGGCLLDPLDPSRRLEVGEEQKAVWSEALSCWSGHEGRDFYCAEGTGIYALEAGEVVRMYEDAFLGNTLVVRGEEGETVYAGLADECALRVGQRVEAGERLGSVGKSGLGEPGAPHLHLQLSQTAATMPAITSDAQASR